MVIYIAILQLPKVITFGFQNLKHGEYIYMKTMVFEMLDRKKERTVIPEG
jgi:hypothetical protein